MHIVKVTDELIKVIRLFKKEDTILIECASFSLVKDVEEDKIYSYTILDDINGFWKPVNIINPVGEAANLLSGSYYTDIVPDNYEELDIETVKADLDNYKPDIANRVRIILNEVGL